MKEFDNKILSVIQKFNMIQSGDKILVGLSGGADSCALLHVLCKLSTTLGFTLVAAHLNHGIRGDEALRDQNHSKAFSEKLGIPFVTEQVSVPQYAEQNKMSEEMAARKLRYDFFKEVCDKHSCNKIAVAHNQNDSVETILLNLIRGSGSKAMDGIKPINGNVIRPLIETTREEIEQYLKKCKIDFVVDSTNLEDNYARNIVRNQIIPRMKSINEGVLNNIIRTSSIVRAESEYLENEIKNLDIINLQKDCVTIKKRTFSQLHIALARRAFLQAITMLCGNTFNVSSKQIDPVISSLKTGNVFTLGNGIKICITSDEIRLTYSLDSVSEYEYELSLPGSLTIKETGASYKFDFVDTYEKKNGVLYINAEGIDKIKIRTRKNGDVFTPYGMKGNKKIKSFYIDNKIPSSERNHYPLLIANDKVAAVLPLRISDDFKINKNTQKILRITLLGGTYDKL